MLVLFQRKLKLFNTNAFIIGDRKMNISKFDLFRKTIQSHSFTQYSSSFDIYPPSDSNKDLNDVEMRFWISPYSIFSSFDATAPKALCFYCNGIDITSHILEEIKESLNSNPSHLNNQYKQALDDWYLTMQKILPRRPTRPDRRHNYQEELRKLKREIDRRKSNMSIQNYIGELGEKDFDGTLHPCCFFYKYIDIPLISINSILDRYNNTVAADEVINISEIEKVTVSHGADVRYSRSHYDPDEAIGKVSIELEWRYKNPLVKKIDKIERLLKEVARKLANIGRSVESNRMNYLAPIKTSVESAHEDVKAGAAETKQALESLKRAVDSV